MKTVIGILSLMCASSLVTSCSELDCYRASQEDVYKGELIDGDYSLSFKRTEREVAIAISKEGYVIDGAGLSTATGTQGEWVVKISHVIGRKEEKERELSAKIPVEKGIPIDVFKLLEDGEDVFVGRF